LPQSAGWVLCSNHAERSSQRGISIEERHAREFRLLELRYQERDTHSAFVEAIAHDRPIVDQVSRLVCEPMRVFQPFACSRVCRSARRTAAASGLPGTWNAHLVKGLGRSLEEHLHCGDKFDGHRGPVGSANQISPFHAGFWPTLNASSA